MFNKVSSLLKRILDFSKIQMENFKKSKNKPRLIMIIVFVCLIVWALVVFVGMYVSKINLRSGFLDVSGRIEGYEYHAGTKISGKVIDMYVEEGDRVSENQPIGKIDSKQIEAELNEARARFEYAKLEYNHYKNLTVKDAIAKIKYNQAEKSYKVAIEAVRKAEANLEDTLIVSPTSGTVVIKIVRPGEVVGVGTPLVTIINMDDLFLKIFLATDVAGKVNLGDEAKVIPDALPRESFDAVVTKIAEKAQFTPKNVETKSQRAKLVFEIKLKIKKNKDYRLKPGMPSSGIIKFKKKAPWKKYRL